MRQPEYVFEWGVIKVPYEEGKRHPIVYGGDASNVDNMDCTDTFDATLFTEAKQYFGPCANNMYIAIVSPGQFVDLLGNMPPPGQVIISQQDDSLGGMEKITETGLPPATEIRVIAGSMFPVRVKFPRAHPISPMRVLLYDNVLVYAHENIPLTDQWGASGTVKGAEAVFMGGSGEGLVLIRTAIG